MIHYFGFATNYQLFISFLGGWQDGATAVCIWIVGQKVFMKDFDLAFELDIY